VNGIVITLEVHDKNCGWKQLALLHIIGSESCGNSVGTTRMAGEQATNTKTPNIKTVGLTNRILVIFSPPRFLSSLLNNHSMYSLWRVLIDNTKH
jgi:hypothetical protein